LNIDGDATRTCDLASFGGILQDDASKFICIFTAKICPCSRLES